MLREETKALEAFSNAVERGLVSFSAFGRVWTIRDGVAEVIYRRLGKTYRVTFRVVKQGTRSLIELAAKGGDRIIEVEDGPGPHPGMINGAIVEDVRYEVTKRIVDDLVK